MKSKKRQKLFVLLTILIGVLLPLLVAEIALQIVGVYGGLEVQVLTRENPVRRYVPDQSFYYTYGRFFELSNSGRVNNYGFVNDQQYDPEGNSPLLAIIGDSYVEAIMVPYSETAQGRLAEDLKGQARVYSFGLSGTALSDYLAYVKYARSNFRPTALVIVVVGNDFDQSLMEYQRQRSQGYHGYVRLPNGELRHELTEYNPVIWKTIKKSALVRYLFIHLQVMRLVSKFIQPADFVGNTEAGYDERRLRLSKQFVDFFLTELPENAGLRRKDIVLVVDGLRPQLYCDECLKGAEDSYFNLMRSYLIVQAEQQGYEVVDMQPIFQGSYHRQGKRFESDIDHHWNSQGHAEVAAALLRTRLIARQFPDQTATP